MIARLPQAGIRTAAALGLMFLLLTFAWPGQGAPWVSTTSLPDGYFSHTLTYASGYLYNIGGCSVTNGNAAGINVFRAPVHDDGTIGAWTNATSLPEAVNNHASVSANGFLYVLGGYHYFPTAGNIASNVVYYGNIHADGTIGLWQTANPLPVNLAGLSASVWSNTIYVIGGFDGNAEHNTVFSATIQTDGSLSAWATNTPVPVPGGPYGGPGIYLHASVANGFLYVLGGLSDGGTDNSGKIYCAKINGGGGIGAWTNTTPLPQGLCSFGAVVAGGRVFTIGGYNVSPQNEFYNATVLVDGSLSSWSAGPNLPQPLSAQGTAASGSYIFTSGGNTNGQATPAVYSMALPAPPVAPTLVARSFTNGNFQLQLTATANTGYGLTASTNFIVWTNIAAGFTGTNGTLLFQDTNAARFPRRFYRAYWPLP